MIVPSYYKDANKMEVRIGARLLTSQSGTYQIRNSTICMILHIQKNGKEEEEEQRKEII